MPTIKRKMLKNYILCFSRLFDTRNLDSDYIRYIALKWVDQDKIEGKPNIRIGFHMGMAQVNTSVSQK